MTKNIHDMMIQKPSLKYRDVRENEGKYYDWAEGEHLLEKGMLVDEIFHPLEHDIRFIKDEQVTLRDGVKILTDVYLPADTDEPLPAIIAWSPYGKNSGNADRFKALFGLLGLDQKRMSGLQKFEMPSFILTHAASVAPRATARCWALRKDRTVPTSWNG